MKIRVTVIALGGIVLVSSCAKIAPPTQEELYARDQWAAIVTEQDRQTVFEEAGLHTGWSEKRKVLYQIDRFKRLNGSEVRKERAATRKASTKPATRSTMRAGTRPSTRKHTGRMKNGVPEDDDMQE